MPPRARSRALNKIRHCAVKRRNVFVHIDGENGGVTVGIFFVQSRLVRHPERSKRCFASRRSRTRRATRSVGISFLAEVRPRVILSEVEPVGRHGVSGSLIDRLSHLLASCRSRSHRCYAPWFRSQARKTSTTVLRPPLRMTHL